MFWGTAHRAHGATLEQIARGSYPLPVRRHKPKYKPEPTCKGGVTGRKWGADEEQYLIDRIGLMTNRKLAKLLTENGWGRTEYAVRHHIKYLREKGAI